MSVIEHTTQRELPLFDAAASEAARRAGMEKRMINEYTDITANYHKGSETSRLANLKAAPKKAAIKQKIVEYARNYGPLTVKDVRRALGLEHQTASARLTELKAAGVLVETDARRDGCKVLALAK